MTTFKRPTKEEAIRELREMGAELSKQEDRYGETKTGWWLDGIWIDNDPIRALMSIKFGC
jgi:hypothetical protein